MDGVLATGRVKRVGWLASAAPLRPQTAEYRSLNTSSRRIKNDYCETCRFVSSISQEIIQVTSELEQLKMVPSTKETESIRGMTRSIRQVSVRDGEIDSQELFQTDRELHIRHGDDTYRLRLTGLNKLILTK